jgi:eukaryotic-like serine/threonine-protein kinase
MRDGNGSALNIVHRDMSPPNVLLTKFGEVKIVDFGLAKANSQLEKSEPGIIKGKFSYLSPEAAMGQDVDSRTDIFAVGIILWELLTGQRLFLGETDFQTVKKVQQAVVPPVGQLNKKVPPELERIVNKALARDPAHRYATARELGIDLSKFMFSYGQPVSTFDIASLVSLAVKEKRVKAPQGSIIDKLIEEALLEFTSLTDEAPTGAGQKPSNKKPAGGVASAISTGQFVDPTNWANEISLDLGTGTADDSLRASLPPDIFQAGNLSALEDEPPSAPIKPPISSPRALQQPQSPAQPMQSAPISGPISAPISSPRSSAPPPMGQMPMPRSLLPSTPPSRGALGGNGAAVGVVVALFAVAAFAAAWFTHLIPH